MPDFDRRQLLATLPLGTLAGTACLAANAERKGEPTPPKAASAPKYRLGLVTYNVAAEWDLPTLLGVCKATGVSPVELRTTHKHRVEPSLSKDQRKQVKKQFADAGVEVWGCGTTCEFHSPNQAEVKKQIETCKRFVELAADVGGKGVKVRPNALPRGVEVAKTLEQIGKALIPCGKAAADAGVEIWVEVHGHGTAYPPHVKTIMQQCGHPKVGLTWNSNRDDVKNGSVAEYFKLLSPWLRSCHINDLLSGYPYRELFGLLKGAGYDRVTLCEYGRVWKDPALGKDFLRYYKGLWNELTRG